jgi:NAD(P)H-hydrate epimerase
MIFGTVAGQVIPAVTGDQMREVDRVAVEEFGLGVLQMMENAGRTLACTAMDMLGGVAGEVTIMAGPGGNGGGGICCARHLHNRGVPVNLVLDRDPEELRGPAMAQYRVLERSGLAVSNPEWTEGVIGRSDLVVDALLGYGLRGAPKGRSAELIAISNQSPARVLALDLPSGTNATTGETPGAAVQATRTLTLALPKTGLRRSQGELYLADIGIPPQVYHRLGINVGPLFGNRYILPILVIE